MKAQWPQLFSDWFQEGFRVDSHHNMCYLQHWFKILIRVEMWRGETTIRRLLKRILEKASPLPPPQRLPKEPPPARWCSELMS